MGDATASALASTYGAAVRTETLSNTCAAGRSNDSAPWNGGDIICNNASKLGGTLGFGVHNTSNGNQFNITAGHIGSGYFYNSTEVNRGAKSSGNTIGSTYPGSFSASQTTPALDVQLISDKSSSSFWEGPKGSFVLYSVVGYADPIFGAVVCFEGAMSSRIVVGGQECRQVTNANSPPVEIPSMFSPYQTLNVSNFFITDFNPAEGDSGGPIIYPTIYGGISCWND